MYYCILMLLYQFHIHSDYRQIDFTSRVTLLLYLHNFNQSIYILEWFIHHCRWKPPVLSALYHNLSVLVSIIRTIKTNNLDIEADPELHWAMHYIIQWKQMLQLYSTSNRKGSHTPFEASKTHKVIITW